MRILVELREVYGNPRIYVKNEPAKSALEKVTGRKTLSSDEVEALRTLGHIIVWADRGSGP